jgi:ABC-2 type transport system permease protein
LSSPFPRLNLTYVKLARDTWLIFQRQMQLVVRSPLWIAFALAQPIAYLLLFAPMLRLALRPEGVTTFTQAYRIYVPGLLTLTVVFGGLFAGFTLLAEIRSGVVERARVTPVSRLALILGRALREVVVLMFQAAVIIALALPFGLRVTIGDLLLAYALLGLMSLMAVALSYGVALRVRNEAALGPMITTVSQPVLLLSGVLLPLTLAPAWFIKVADFNPFYWVTNGMRDLFNEHLGNPQVWQSAIIVVALVVITVTWSARQFTRSVQ